MCLKYFLSQTKHICQPPVRNLCPISTLYSEGHDPQRGAGADLTATAWQGWEGQRAKLPEPSPGLFLYQVMIPEFHRSVSLLG